MTARSSPEWNEITASRPPSASQWSAAARPPSSSSPSSLTALRRAWKVRVAGWMRPPARPIDRETTSARPAVRRKGARRRAPFLRTAGLAEVVSRSIGRAGGRIHPATRTFQALRRAVNEEGDELLGGLAAADHWLADGGRLAVISFHSGEDRAVKHFLQRGGREGRWDILTRKPLTASSAEVRDNRRARSARLRAAERLEDVAA